MRLRVMGVVIGPTFQFDATQVKFGTISYGKCSVPSTSVDELDNPRCNNVHVHLSSRRKGSTCTICTVYMHYI